MAIPIPTPVQHIPHIPFYVPFYGSRGGFQLITNNGYNDIFLVNRHEHKEVKILKPTKNNQLQKKWQPLKHKPPSQYFMRNSPYKRSYNKY